MINFFLNEGSVINSVELDNLKQNNFFFSERDIKIRKKNDDENEFENVINFSGFLINNRNEILTIFPKKYKPVDLEEDSSNLFLVINKHIQKKSK